MIALIARILLRYIAGALIAAGILPAALGADLANDPEVLAVIGVALGAVTEGLYALAKRKGWTT